MKKVLFFSFLIISSFSLFAQMPGGMMGAGQSANSAIGRLYGKLIDSSGKGIGDASMMLLQNKYDSATKKNREVLLKGVTTQANGDFNFEGLPIFRPLKL